MVFRAVPPLGGRRKGKGCVIVILRQVEQWRDSGALGQLIRFVLTGGVVTALYSLIYLGLARRVVSPQVAGLTAYAVCVVIGYVLHSRFSFQGHGARDNTARTTSRFFMASLVGQALNSGFIWLLTEHMNGPTWWAVIPQLFVTPLVAFALNRLWVFA
ncbi:GtrA family protein [Sphingomonas sp. Leaf17]|uniref:GtrA family protein n=1 Tax=Sphingomonas sp. Leaf17 TaxID=1735683 RepID=UPI000B09551E|nr:GtrA family protein [Sphingomonas sp. Leaf17]